MRTVQLRLCIDELLDPVMRDLYVRWCTPKAALDQGDVHLHLEEKKVLREMRNNHQFAAKGLETVDMTALKEPMRTSVKHIVTHLGSAIGHLRIALSPRRTPNERKQALKDFANVTVTLRLARAELHNQWKKYIIQEGIRGAEAWANFSLAGRGSSVDDWDSTYQEEFLTMYQNLPGEHEEQSRRNLLEAAELSFKDLERFSVTESQMSDQSERDKAITEVFTRWIESEFRIPSTI